MKIYFILVLFLALTIISAQNTSTIVTETDDSQCSNFNGECEECIPVTGCIYCTDTSECIPGTIIPNDRTSCKNFQAEQCAIEGRWIYFAVFGSVGLVLLIIICCLLKSFCWTSKKKVDKNDYFRYNEDSMGTPKTDSRRTELRKKYGLYETELKAPLEK